MSASLHWDARVLAGLAAKLAAGGVRTVADAVASAGALTSQVAWRVHSAAESLEVAGDTLWDVPVEMPGGRGNFPGPVITPVKETGLRRVAADTDRRAPGG